MQDSRRSINGHGIKLINKAMNYSVETFLGYLNKRGGPSHSNRYYVELAFPEGLNPTPNASELNLICSSAVMPGHVIMTAEKTALSNPIKVPYSFGTEEAEFVFLLDGRYKAMEAFNAWSEKIINTKTHEVAYKKEIVAGKWTIWQLNTNNEKTAGIAIYNVFLTQIGKVDFSDAAHNQLQSLSISVTYDRRETVKPDFT